MSIRILSVDVTPKVTTVGQPVTIVVAAEEVKWSSLKADFVDWGEVRRSFTSWNKVKNYIYTKYNPTPTSDCVYSSDGYALFDVDGVEISINGGYTSKHSATDINQVIGEVLNG